MKAITALQKLILNPKSNVTDILRSAFLISQKLGLDDFKSWCEFELKGYENIDEENVPEYRHIYGSFHLRDVRTGKSRYVTDQAVGQTIKDGVIFFQEILLIDQKFYDLTFPDNINSLLKEKFNLKSNHYIFYMQVSKVSLEKILDIIKTKVLEFSVELERKGILGEEWEFTEKEKTLAINITNFQGILGDVKHSSVQQTNTLLVQKNDFESLKKYLESNGVETQDILELKDIIDVSPLPKSSNEYSPEVKSWIKKMISKSIDGSWQIGVATASSVIATAIQNYFGILS